MDQLESKLSGRIDQVEARLSEHITQEVAKLSDRMTKLEGKITLLHWMIAFTLAGVVSLVTKAFLMR